MSPALRTATMCALLCAASAAAPAGSDKLQSRVWPAFTQAPASVRIEALVEPNADNRELEIVVDSGDYYRSSIIALDGADAPRFFSVQYRSMPAGVYEVQVGLRGPSGTLIALEHHWLDVTP